MYNVGALWIRKSREGKDYITISLRTLQEEIRLVAFPNSNKKTDNQPDYLIYRDNENQQAKTKIDTALPPLQSDIPPTSPPVPPISAATESIDISDIPL